MSKMKNDNVLFDRPFNLSDEDLMIETYCNAKERGKVPFNLNLKEIKSRKTKKNI
jgi:hypothetical protein